MGGVNTKDEGTSAQGRARKTSSTQTKGPVVKLPLKPPSKKRAKLIPDPNQFRDLDERAKRVRTVENVETLAKSLTSQYNDNLQKVRAIFTWLAFNITYDTDRARRFGSRQQPQDPKSVLKSKMAVCQGYSELCQALCRAADVDCLVVSGFSKGSEHSVETVYTPDKEANHAWNLVHVKGEWHPLDCTWGAGHMDGSEFKREFNEHWFLPDPEDFLPTHFPYIDRYHLSFKAIIPMALATGMMVLNDSDLAGSRPYQLVSRPIDLQTFSAMAKPENSALKIGLQFITHTRTVIDVKNDVTIKVKVKSGRQPLESVTASMTESTSSFARADASSVLASLQDDGTCCVYVKPPRGGKFYLTIMGRTKELASGTVYQLVNYIINCTHQGSNSASSGRGNTSSQANKEHKFPDHSGTWGWMRPMAAECGLKIGKNAPFKFTAQNGEVAVPVLFSQKRDTILTEQSCGRTIVQSELYHADNTNTNLTQYTFLEYSSDKATVSARLPRPGYYLLRIFASHPNKGKSLQQVADLLLFSDKRVQDCQPFPQAYTFAHDQNVRLLEPRSGKIKAGVKTRFRVEAPTLAKVKVAEQCMTLKKNCWEAEVTPEIGKRDVSIFGAKEKGAVTLGGLYRFDVSR